MSEHQPEPNKKIFEKRPESDAEKELRDVMGGLDKPRPPFKGSRDDVLIERIERLQQQLREARARIPSGEQPDSANVEASTPTTGSAPNESLELLPEKPLLAALDPVRLPETAAELVEVVRKPRSLVQAMAALEKLGNVCGRSAIDELKVADFASFHPIVISTGVGSDPDTIRSFALYAVPLRKSLADHFEVESPDVAMMLDLAVLAYWKAMQAERAVSNCLLAAMTNPHQIDNVVKFERVKERAVGQLTLLLEALRTNGGRRATTGANADVTTILPFPSSVKPGRKRPRSASAG